VEDAAIILTPIAAGVAHRWKIMGGLRIMVLSLGDAIVTGQITNKEKKMETLYRKVGRKYIPAGHNIPDIPDGLYWTTKTKYGRRGTSVNYWAGSNPPQPLDIEKLVSIMSQDDKLADYLMALQDGESD
jgi:hypothetical protein